MQLQRHSNKQFITLNASAALGQGGEARIYAVPQDESLVAKVYHKPQLAHEHKLVAMLANPPDNPLASQGKIAIAWPIDLLRQVDDSQRVVGFLMPYVKGMHSILKFYNPRTRRQTCPHFSYLYLHRTARNLAAAVGALHERGYCVGDVNESNILVSDTALVTLVDTDSFQVRSPDSDIIYRCPVGKPEFTPPELQNQNFGQLDRSPEHDLFGLAVLIFQLLMEGTHPFSGIFRGIGEPPPYETRIKDGHFAYCRQRSVPYIWAPTAPPFEILHPTLQQLFIRCFEDGHAQPHSRPSAETWQSALVEAEKALIVCNVNIHHLYGNHLKSCPWCDRTLALGGRDPFPSTDAVQRRQHLQPVSRKRVTSPVGDFATTYSRQTLNRRSSFINPTLAKKRFGPFFLGLLGVAILGILEVTVTIRDLDFVPDSSANPLLENVNVAIPDGNNSDRGALSFYRQGYAYYNLGDYEGAIENFNQALRLDPHNAKAYFNRGNAYYQMAQSSNSEPEYRQALEDFNQALRLNSHDAETYFKRGLVRSEIARSKDSREYQGAIEDFNQAIRLDPRNVQAYVSRGNIRYQLAQQRQDYDLGYKGAIEDFNQALKLNSQVAEAYSQRGLIRYQIARVSGNSSQDYSEAVGDLQKAAKIFLEQGDMNHYQQSLSNICMALENNCTVFLQNPEKFINSGASIDRTGQ